MAYDPHSKYKRCPRCERPGLIREEDFSLKSSTLDGYRVECKRCNHDRYVITRDRNAAKVGVEVEYPSLLWPHKADGITVVTTNEGRHSG